MKIRRRSRIRLVKNTKYGSFSLHFSLFYFAAVNNFVCKFCQRIIILMMTMIFIIIIIIMWSRSTYILRFTLLNRYIEEIILDLIQLVPCMCVCSLNNWIIFIWTWAKIWKIIKTKITASIYRKREEIKHWYNQLYVLFLQSVFGLVTIYVNKPKWWRK